jgi:hypothetical protein
MQFERLIGGEVAGCAITLDTLRYVPPSEDAGGNTIYLVGFSAQTSVARAAWANLIAPHCSSLHVDDARYVLAEGGKGWELRTSRVSHGIDEMVLFPPCADRWAGVQEILVVDRAGQSPAETLMRFLEYRSSVPLDSAWANAVWQWALDSGACLDLDGFGPRAWLVRVSDEVLLGSLGRFLADAASACADVA